MELMNQPFTGQLGNRLIELLDSGDYHTLIIMVAFAKNSGVLRIKDSLERFRTRGGTVNVYVGVDLGGTSYEALTALLLHTDSLNVVHSERGQTFHSKIYLLLGEDQGLMVVGSHNLTGGGLWTNFESSVFIPVGGADASETRTLGAMDDYIRELTSLNDSFMPIDTQDDIERLLQNGYLFKEVAERVRLARAAAQNEARDGTQERLFGNGAPANLPHIAPHRENEAPRPAAGAPVIPVAPARTITVPPREESQTIWFETRSMTGGSRNILDLSMKSLVEHGDPSGTSFDLGDSAFMRGGVEFFGLDPAETDQIKDITLNFEGVDYADNRILFPDGDNANGTWRLQIKGTSPSGSKITEVFRAKGVGHYLVKKIITFTKVQDGYYFMSVFPESDLEDFKAASQILARNGATRSAKQLGLL